MFDIEEENEPGGNGYRMLDHCPCTDRHHSLELVLFKSRSLVQTVFLPVTSETGVGYEEYQGYQFSKAGSDSSSGDAQSRTTEFTENQYPIEQDIGYDHYY